MSFRRLDYFDVVEVTSRYGYVICAFRPGIPVVLSNNASGGIVAMKCQYGGGLLRITLDYHWITCGLH